MAWLRWVMVPVVLFLFHACTLEATDTGGETNWLRCERDTDCPGNGFCVEGTCSSADAALGATGVSGNIDSGPPAQGSSANDTDSGTPGNGVLPTAGDSDGGGNSGLVCTEGGCTEPVPDRPPPVAFQWSGNASTCPTAEPTDRDACDVTEGQVCTYWYVDEYAPSQYYTSCACFAAGTDSFDWYCYNKNPGDACPNDEQPEHGSSCFGFKDSECHYPPMIKCDCPAEGDDPLWDCHDVTAERAIDPPEMVQTTAIQDLTPAEQQTWCEWFEPVSHFVPGEPVLNATPDGYYPSGGCLTSSDPFFTRGNRPNHLPASACASNLALSSCAMPLSALTDCVRTMWMQWPQPHGCAPYMDSPGCDGTIVTSRSDCRVRVE